MTNAPKKNHIHIPLIISGIVIFFGIIFGVDLYPGKPEITYTFAIAILMAFWWVSEALPIGVTSFLPLILFPLLGVLNGRTVADAYINDVIFLFIGGFLMALAMEKWELHKRIALKVLSIVGGSPFMILFGFMLSSAFLSMWMSNTATTMMMLPIAFSVSNALEEVHGPDKIKQFLAGLLLSVAYACSIGGIATLVGTPPNLSFLRLFSILYPEGPSISFGQWIAFAFPITIVMFLFTLLIIYKIYKPKEKIEKLDKSFFNDQYVALGRTSSEERKVFVLFIALVLLWVFRSNINLGFITIPGWSSLFSTPNFITDGTVSILIAVLLFMIPSSKKKEALLTWEITKKIPWNIVFLFGGGFALAKGFVDSGLSNYAGSLLSGASNFSPTLLIGTLTGLMSMLTEFTSNTATTEMILPVISGLANEIGVNPLLIMIPVTLAASLAFMLPIATPPNAIAFSTGKLTIAQMIKTGFVINIFAIIVILFFTITWGTIIFNIDPAVFPEWAQKAVNSGL